MTKKTVEEEEKIFDKIENASNNLSDQVGDLQKFLAELRASMRYKQDDEGGVQYG